MDIQAISREILVETAKTAFSGSSEAESGESGNAVMEKNNFRREESSSSARIPDRAEARDMVGQLNKLMTMFDKSVRFMVKDGENNFRVAIVDRKTDQVIKEFPPEQLVNVVNRIRDAVGVIIDEKI